MRPLKEKPPRLSFVRPPLERMVRIHRILLSGTAPTAEILARDLEVSAKTIYRDLEFMRDRLELPLEFCRTRHGFRYTEEVSSFPGLQITEGELFALLVAEKALEQYRGTSFEEPLMSAFQKMAACLPDTISLNLNELGESISFRTSAEPVLNLQIFDRLAKAAVKREQLVLSYRKPGRQEAEPRTIDPYHLANINGEWFLFAYCHLRGGIRTFVPGRIKSIKATGQTFQRPKDFSLKRRLQDSFGVHAGEGKFQIRIQFHELVADYIREKKWHASQQLRELPEGGVELCLTLSSLVEVQRWVLGWGGYATVLDPPELAAAVCHSARRILAGVSDSPVKPDG